MRSRRADSSTAVRSSSRWNRGSASCLEKAQHRFHRGRIHVIGQHVGRSAGAADRGPRTAPAAASASRRPFRLGSSSISAAGGVHMPSDRLSANSGGVTDEPRTAIPCMPGPRGSLALLTPSTRTGVWVPWVPPARWKMSRVGRSSNDFFLEHGQALENGLGPRRAARNVDVHRQDLVDALHHAVDVVHAAGVGARPHGDDPFGFGHLLVEPQHHRGDLFEDGAGNDEQVGLPRGRRA